MKIKTTARCITPDCLLFISLHNTNAIQRMTKKYGSPQRKGKKQVNFLEPMLVMGVNDVASQGSGDSNRVSRSPAGEFRINLQLQSGREARLCRFLKLFNLAPDPTNSADLYA